MNSIKILQLFSLAHMQECVPVRVHQAESARPANRKVYAGHSRIAGPLYRTCLVSPFWRLEPEVVSDRLETVRTFVDSCLKRRPKEVRFNFGVRLSVMFLLQSAPQLFMSFGLLNDPFQFIPTFNTFLTMTDCHNVETLLYIFLQIHSGSSSRSKCCVFPFRNFLS